MSKTNKSEIALIVQDYLTKVLIDKGINFQVDTYDINYNEIHIPSTRVNQVVDCLCNVGDSMDVTFGDFFQQTCLKLENELGDLNYLDYDSFKGVADELFSKGIKWGHIGCLLIFGSQLIISTSNDNPSRDFIKNINEYLINYIKDNLLSWINDHDSWNGLIRYCNQLVNMENRSVVDGILPGNSFIKKNFKQICFSACIVSVALITAVVLIKK